MNKKFLFLLIALFTIVILPIDIAKAGECDNEKYACAVCVYKKANSDIEVTYTVKSNGESVDFARTHNYRGTWDIYERFTAIDFISENDNKLFCPKLQWVVNDTNGKKISNVFLDGDCTMGSICQNWDLLTNKSTNNNQSVFKNGLNKISCTYKDNEFTGVINVINNQIQYELPSTYQINASLTNITPEMFSSGTCPSLNFSCNSIGASGACAFSYNDSGGGNSSGNDKGTEEIVYVCGLFGPKTFKYIKLAFTLTKILIPVLVIILGMLDFVKVVFSGEDKDMKTAGTRFLKRVIIGVLILLLPVLIQFIMELVGFSDNSCLYQIIK